MKELLEWENACVEVSLPKTKLKTPMKTRFASKVIVLFQETCVMSLTYVIHVKLEFYMLGFQLSKLGLW
jgi:hypothetical protein